VDMRKLIGEAHGQSLKLDVSDTSGAGVPVRTDIIDAIHIAGAILSQEVKARFNFDQVDGDFGSSVDLVCTVWKFSYSPTLPRTYGKLAQLIPTPWAIPAIRGETPTTRSDT
jgi:hypothetical protein